MAIQSKDSFYADAHLVALESETDGDLYKEIDTFRQHLQRQHLYEGGKGGSSHFAFSTTNSNSSNLTLRGQSLSKPPKPCLCGEQHWIADCYYLVPEKRHTGWTPNSTKQKKVDEAMKIDRTKTWVETCLQRRKAAENKSSGGDTTQTSKATATTPSSQTQPPTQRVQGGASFAVQATDMTYPLESSWISDNGLDTHVCNSTMLSRFTQTRSAHPKDQFTAGTQTLPIECFGTIDMTIQTPTGFQLLTLGEVAYVSQFLTNIVCEERLHIKDVFFSSQKMHLHRDSVMG